MDALTCQSLWVDTDIAMGADAGDVDDGFALAAVLATVRIAPRRWQLAGVSAVGGNTNAAQAHDCARHMLDVWGFSNTPLFRADQAAGTIATMPAGTRLIALGPLTNVAAALSINPALASRTALAAVGGVVDHRRHPLLRFFCLNFRHDPGAMQQVLRAPWERLQLFPLDVVQRLRFGAEDLAAVAASGAHGVEMAAQSTRWLRQAWWRYASRRFPVWDLVAALAMLDALPEARYDANGRRLLDFNPSATRDAYLTLLTKAQSTSLSS